MSYKLANFPFNMISDKTYKQARFAKTSEVVNVKAIDYAEADSPLRFRSFITVYTDDPAKADSKPMRFEQTFYLSTLMKTDGSVPPEEVLSYKDKRGDFFFVRHYKESAFGQFMGIVAIEAACIAVDVALDPNTYR